MEDSHADTFWGTSQGPRLWSIKVLCNTRLGYFLAGKPKPGVLKLLLCGIVDLTFWTRRQAADSMRRSSARQRRDCPGTCGFLAHSTGCKRLG